MSLLLIDIGNTAIHWAIKQGGQDLTPMQSCVYRDEAIETILTRHWSELPPVKTVFISSVAAEEINSAVQQWLHKTWKLTPHFMTSVACSHGVKNAYAEPKKLGADRWAALVAAFHQSQGACCILDCGTAVTFDVIAANGQHLGGWIMPGYRLFRQSLSQDTAGIGVTGDTLAATVVLGRDTTQCVDVAWHQGIVGLIQRSLSELGMQDIDGFITGGDAKKMQPLLGENWCYANDLVLQGLAMMASPD